MVLDFQPILAILRCGLDGISRACDRQKLKRIIV